MSEKSAVVRQVKGLTFVGMAESGHWVNVDGPPEFGGSNAAIRPKELILISLGACTGSDVISILQKKRVKPAGFEVRLKAQVAEEHPQVYTKIHIEYVFYGENLPAPDIERAIDLSQNKYCPVTAMLKSSVDITNSYKILPSGDFLGAKVN
ncbi:MAG TPA: OsmC family protein [Candidatus Acidoferrales bacterium]|nr:OsmC family protein [Candidatus Acidoferrales bacterium]